MHAPTMTAQEIADLLHMNIRTFQNKLPKLRAEGFPNHLPGTRVWSRRLVTAWLDQRDPAADASIADIDPVAAARAELEARISGRAA